MSVTKNSSNTRTIVAIVISVIVVILITLGIWVNTALKVKVSVKDNQNILIDNGNLINTKLKTLEDSTKLDDKATLAVTTKSSKETFDKGKLVLDEAKNSALEAKEKLKAGFDSDTNEYYNEGKKVMDKRIELIDQTYKAIVDFECVTNKVLAIGNNFELVGNKLTSIDPNNNKEISGIIDESVVFVGSANQENLSLGQCFDSTLKPFYTESLKSAITKDSTYYTNFAAALKLLSDGSKTNNLTKINEANSQITALGATTPSVFSNPDFTSLLSDKAPQTIQNSINELDQQTLTLNNLSKKISDKYFGI